MCLLLLGSLIFYSQLAVAGLRLAVCWADRHNHILQFSSLIDLLFVGKDHKFLVG